MFGGDTAVEIAQFIPVFEEEFVSTPDSNIMLTELEREVLIKLLDAYPTDGLVSLVEWKRFCKQSKRAQFGLKDFITYMSTHSSEMPVAEV
jgi:hypothetical protein